MNEASSAPVVRKDDPWRLWTPVLTLYGASLMLALTEPPVSLAAVALCVFAVGAGVWIVLRSTFWNVGVLFSAGFVQALVFAIPAAIRNPDPVVGAFSIVPSLLTGFAVATGGVLTGVLRKNVPTGAFSISVWGSWLRAVGNPLSSAEATLKAFMTIAQLYALGRIVLERLK